MIDMADDSRVGELLRGWPCSMATFGEFLAAIQIPYLSFSKIACVEFCEQRYLLEFVKREKLRPQPEYFVKGRLFHEAAARVYRWRRRGSDRGEFTAARYIRREAHEWNLRHLRNALGVLLQNLFEGWEVVGVEQPFALTMDAELPPVVGVIDLLLRRGRSEYAVVDHKTGKGFYDQDSLQVALYARAVRHFLDARRCVGFFDQYRWVENLDRIRKPAFVRERVRDPGLPRVLRRIKSAHSRMLRIERGGEPSADGACYMCPYRYRCDRASAGWPW